MNAFTLLAAGLALGFFLAWLWLYLQARRRVSAGSKLPEVYLRGLNYLLNEQPDAAIDAFIDILSAHPETAEIHLALGRLFRRRGEIERSIRVHKNLLDQQTLDQNLRQQAMFELGTDYFKAGILDRAEQVFKDLLVEKADDRATLHFLADIYEIEQDWASAVQVRQQLASLGSPQDKAAAAFLYCEMAEQALQAGDPGAANAHLTEAYHADPASPRGTLVAGKVAMATGQYQQALDLWDALLRSRPGLFPLVLEDFMACAETSMQPQLKQKTVLHLAETVMEPAAVDSIARLLATEQGAETALHYLHHHLSAYPQLTALRTYADIATQSGQMAPEHALFMAALLDKIPAERCGFQCADCGFYSPGHYWKCPGCRRWDSMQPALDFSRRGAHQ